MKFIIMVTAALFAMLSVAAADEWPRKKPRPATTTAPIPKSPVRATARPAPARPGVLQPAERDGAQVAPAAAKQPERPSAGANAPAGVAPEEQREAGGGSPEHNVQPPASERPGATVGGE